MPDEDDIEIDDVIAESVLEETQIPDEAHILYYSLREGMKANLPQDEQFEKLRKQIYEEKNIYINRGNKKMRLELEVQMVVWISYTISEFH